MNLGYMRGLIFAVRGAALAVGLIFAACSPGYDMADPARDHVLAFTAADATWYGQLTTYHQVFATSNSNAPLTLMRIVVASTPHLCDDTNVAYVAPNSSRLVLQGFVDGDATNAIPNSTTWSSTYTDLPKNAAQLSQCEATFYALDDQGHIHNTVYMLSGTVTFAQSGDPNFGEMGLSFDLIPQVGGSQVHLRDANSIASYCVR